MKPELFLYTRVNCSACNIFKDRLDENNIRYYMIDIAGDPELHHRYGARLPVLVGHNTEICEGIYNDQALRNYLCGLNS